VRFLALLVAEAFTRTAVFPPFSGEPHVIVYPFMLR
jgi:hypothetical protein